MSSRTVTFLESTKSTTANTNFLSTHSLLGSRSKKKGGKGHSLEEIHKQFLGEVSIDGSSSFLYKDESIFPAINAYLSVKQGLARLR